MRLLRFLRRTPCHPYPLLSALLLIGSSAVSGEPLRLQSAPSPPPPAGISADWVGSVERSLVEREYQASVTPRGLQAPNRAQGFRIFFGANGLRVVERTATPAAELLRLRLITVELDGVGLGGAAEVPTPVANGARVETARGGFIEHAVNGPDGLRFGVRIPAAASREARRLVVEWEVAGALLGSVETVASAGWDRLPLTAGSGRRLELRRVPVVEATVEAGRGEPGAERPLASATLVSRFEVADRGLMRLVIDLEASSSPGPVVRPPGPLGVIVAELLLTGVVDGIVESNQATAHFGLSVSGAGDVNADGYGDVIVGADLYDSGETDEGAAFVFLGSGSGVASGNPASASAVLQSNQAGAQMGVSVSGAGDVNGDGYEDVIVGARYHDLGETDEGAAFVFLGGASGVTSGNPASASATLQSNQVGAELGTSVSGAGDVNGDGYADVIVGAYLYDLGETDEGAAFVFLGSPSGVASGNPSNASATLQSNQAGARLGRSVSGAGDVSGDGYADVIAGAYWYDSAQSQEGAAFVFLGSSSGVPSGSPASASATLQSNQADAYFGITVSGAGDVNGDGYGDLIVGALFYDSGEIDEGAAFVFLGSASGVASGNPSTASATLQSDQAGASLGARVSGAGDVNGDGYGDVIVGAYLYDLGETDEGAAFVFLGRAAGVASGNPSSAWATLQANQADAQFGGSAVGAGDVNGDGYGDVIVGAALYDSGQTDEGAALVFLGGAAGVTSGNPSTASALLQMNQGGSQFGASVSEAGDVNGDGYGDVIVGANGFDYGQVNSGAAFVFLGSASGLSTADPSIASAILHVDQPNSGCGYSASGAGDVNGDGYGDVIVGAYLFDGGQTDEGAALVFLGSATGVASGNASTASALLQSDQAQAYLGLSVSAAGDVNGDGYGDVIVGAYSYDLGQTDEGTALVFLGSATGVASGNPASASAILQSNQTDALLGASVAGAGDLNGDGYADVIVGASLYDSGETDEGAAFVFLGSASGVASANPSSASAILQSNQTNASFGLGVSGAGDVNGDGYADVIVGSYLYDLPQADEGAAFVFLGSASGVASGNPSSASAILQSNQAGAYWGYSVAAAGDLNGDGYGDVIVGARLYDAGQSDEGAAFVFPGSATGVASGDPTSASATLESNQAGAFLGWTVSGAGDVNGDGFGDVIAGAYLYSAGQTSEGAAFVFLGNGGRAGRPVGARQLRPGSSLPVAPWGSSRDLDAFDVGLFATHPAGGGRVKLQLEACLAGTDFGDPSCTVAASSAWSNVTATSGAALVEQVSGLLAARLYHWRARVLYASASVVASGITAPPFPPHGPWRRFQAQVTEADLRTQNGGFYTLPPCRVVDTRGGAPIAGPVLTHGLERTLAVAGQCSIPLSARAVSLNLTAVAPLGAGWLVMYPVAGAATNTTAISFNANATRANNAVFGLNGLGQLQVLPFVTNPAGPDQVHLVVDVNGYFE